MPDDVHRLFLQADFPKPANLCWLRRDLRLHDNKALFNALQGTLPVACVFVFDPALLQELSPDSKQFAFMYGCLQELQTLLRQQHSDLILAYGAAPQLIPRLAQALGSQTVYANRDYEPYAVQRDAQVAQALYAQGCSLQLSKDQVIFEQDEILTQQGAPYSVFTPYQRKWLSELQATGLTPCPSERHLAQLLPVKAQELPTPEELGFKTPTLTKLLIRPGVKAAQQSLDDFANRLASYEEKRDFPAKNGVSRLSSHLRFGTLSIRECVALAWPSDSAGAFSWLKELIWREFYQQFLWHYPESSQQSVKPEYQQLDYPGQPSWWQAWCRAETGYPLVDAALRQLLHSGYMHNRLRMVVASFLVKDLLLDWRLGERFFAQHLIDYDQAANVGGWQWAASTGCDAQPYFRIFNPITQSRKFDPQGQFIRRYIPELSLCDDKSIHAPWQSKTLPANFKLGRDYPLPIVEHDRQRLLALNLFTKKPIT